MATLRAYSTQSIIHNLTLAKQRIAECHYDSAQNWIDSAISTLLLTVVQDVEAETIPAPAPAEQVAA